jgi:hypothetical protein
MNYLNLQFFGDARHRIKEIIKLMHTMLVTKLNLPNVITHCKSTYAILFKYGTLDGD